MRRVSVLVVLCLCLVAGVKAQKSSLYERKDFSFKMTTEKDSDGKIRTVKLHACVGSNAVSNFTFKVVVPTEDIGEITEPDINFDGYPDLLIYCGMGGPSFDDDFYTAYVWNPDTREFFNVDDFENILNPVFDRDDKTIKGFYNDEDGRVIETYRWDEDGKRIELVSRQTQTEPDN